MISTHNGIRSSSGGGRTRSWRRVQDLIAFLRRQRPAYVSATSRDDYDWALQSAITTLQDVAAFRVTPPRLLQQMERGGGAAVEPGQELLDMASMREVAMLDNISWIVDREASSGHVFLFAHIGHLQKQVHGSVEVKNIDGMGPLGVYAQSKYGTAYVVVGTYSGRAEGFPEGFRPPAPNSNGNDGLLASIGLPAFIADLRQLPRGTPPGGLVRAAPQDAQQIR